MFKKFKKISVGILAVLCVLTAAWADEPNVELEGWYWVTDLTAKARVTESGLSGTEINFKDDLGIGDENFLEGRFTWHTGSRSRLRLAYTAISYEEESTITKNINFGGKTYTAGSKVKSSLDINYLRLAWVWQFLGAGPFKVGPMVEVKGFWVDTMLDAPALNIEESEDFAFGLPTVGVAADIKAHELINIFAEVSGITAGKYGYFLDGEAGVKIIPLKNLGAIAGYRIFDIKAKDDPDYARLKISGPYVGVTVRF